MMLFVAEMPNDARDKILFAGLSFFTKEGYRKTSVLDVVEMARVSKTTFYQNFSSKEDLMAVLLEVLVTEILEEVKIAIDRESRMAYKAYQGIRRYIEICLSDMKTANLILVESVGVSQEVEKVRNEGHRRFAQLMFHTVQGLLPQTVSETEMHIVSQAMIGAINEVIMQNYHEGEANFTNFDELARLLNRIVIGAFVNLDN